MSEYTLNDIKYTPAPLTLCPIGQGYDDVDAEEVEKEFQKNRALLERLQRDFNDRKRTGQRIV